jgi:hypothetical protein
MGLYEWGEFEGGVGVVWGRWGENMTGVSLFGVTFRSIS